MPLEGIVSGPLGQSHVQPKAMDVLLCLTEHEGRVVGRWDVVHAVWGENYPTEQPLTRCISELRSAFGDDPQSPSFIQTVPRRGYRILVKPEPLSTEKDSAAPSGEATPGRSASTQQWQRVLRAGSVYAALAWVITQIVIKVFPIIGLPDWTATLVAACLVVGFPILLLVAWSTGQAAGGAGRVSRLPNLAGSLLILVATAALFFVLRPGLSRGGEGGPPTPTVASTVAVLPFENLGGNPDTDYVGQGLAEDILSLLGTVPEIRTVSRAASFYYGERETDPRTIANRLGADRVLTGSVRAEGEAIRVTAELVDGDTGTRVWSGRYDRKVREVLALQDEIAKAVFDALQVTLGRAAGAMMTARLAEDPEAYKFYLQGRYYLNKPKEQETLAIAVDLFTRALEISPIYPRARAGLCDAHVSTYELTFDPTQIDVAMAHCEAAIGEGAALFEPHVSLGTLYRFTGRYDESARELEFAEKLAPKEYEVYDELAKTYEKQHRITDAEATYLKAIEVAPSYWGGYVAVGTFYKHQNQHQKSIEYFEHALDLTPDNVTAANNLALAYFLLGDFDAAQVAWEQSLDIAETALVLGNLANNAYYRKAYDECARLYRRALEKTPDDYLYWGGLGACQRYGPDPDSAFESFDRARQMAEAALAINPSDGNLLATLSLYYVRVGRDAQALEAVEQGLDLAPRDLGAQFFAALTLLSLDRREAAAEAVIRAIELGIPVALMAAEPDLEPLRGSPRLAQVLPGAEKEKRPTTGETGNER